MNIKWFTVGEWADYWGLEKQTRDDALVWFIDEGYVEPAGMDEAGEMAFAYTEAGLRRRPFLRRIRPLRVWKIEA